MIIWLASYPRSGSTYFRSVLKHYFDARSYSLYGDRGDIGANPELGRLVGHEDGDKDSLDLDALRTAKERFFIKTHELPDELISPEDTVFYIVRDGRDACASYLHYLKSVRGLETTTLEDVLAGAVAFGFWGHHVAQWHQVRSDNVHRFKFEEITANSESFADVLSRLLGPKCASGPFPDFGTFSKVAPSFFGKGTRGSHDEVFSGVHRALFELYSGPAMRLAGYEHAALSDDQIAAYATYCNQIDALRPTVRMLKTKNSALAKERADLDKKRKELSRELVTCRKARETLESELSLITEKYNRVIKYTGLQSVRWLVAKSRGRTT
jgi:Sulfotransferase domain